MKKHPTNSRPRSGLALRRRAVRALSRAGGERPAAGPEDSAALLRALQVHQVELEMQNEDLRTTQSLLQRSHARYTELYEFAPVGYFTFDEQGRILESNSNGARLLSADRRLLARASFAGFLTPASRSVFLLHLLRVFKTKERQAAEISIRRADGSRVIVHMESVQAFDREQGRCCRTAVMDVTEQRRADDALRKARDELEARVAERTRKLSEGNLALEAQVAQRERAEEALKRAQEALELRVRQRTTELVRTNHALEAEIRYRKQLETARQQVLRRLVEAEETERSRVARELHDQFGQQLAALRLGLKAVGEQLPTESPARSRFAQSLTIADNLLRGVHTLVWKLRPPALDDLGLTAALRHDAAEWTKLSGVPVDVRCRGVEKHRLSAEMETMLYRIAQEAITNVFKHSHATRVGVLVECRRGRVTLSVKDNGCGFEFSQTLKRGPNGHARLGITGMQERAALAGGSVEIESAPRAGTTVFVRIPGPQPARSNANSAYEKDPRPARRRPRHHA